MRERQTDTTDACAQLPKCGFTALYFNAYCCKNKILKKKGGKKYISTEIMRIKSFAIPFVTRNLSTIAVKIMYIINA